MRTVIRIINFFAPHERAQIRQGLAESLVGVVSQRLLPRVGGGRVLGMEVMLSIATIRKCIKQEDKLEEIKQAVEEGGLHGMQTFGQHVVQLVGAGLLSREDALKTATRLHEVKVKLMQASFASSQTAAPPPSPDRRGRRELTKTYNQAKQQRPFNGSLLLHSGARSRIRTEARSLEGCCATTTPISRARAAALVEATGFEPATPWSQTKCATSLRYASSVGAQRGV